MTVVLDQLARLRRASDCIGEMTRAGASAPAIIDRLIAEHGAAVKTGPSTNSLRIAGVVTSCTWSRDQGLISGWRRLATRRILQLEGRCE